MSEWISTSQRLPKDGQKVLCIPTTCHEEAHCTVATFHAGITAEERERLLSAGDQRGKEYRHEDEWGNNLKPYYWDGPGPMDYNGQECSYWMPLPGLPDDVRNNPWFDVMNHLTGGDMSDLSFFSEEECDAFRDVILDKLTHKLWHEDR